MIYLAGNLHFCFYHHIENCLEEKNINFIGSESHTKPYIHLDNNRSIRRIYFDTWEEGELLREISNQYRHD